MGISLRIGFPALCDDPGVPERRCLPRLDATLAALGMSDAFGQSRADFSGMDGRKGRLCIGAVLPKGFVAVNEEGTEAAAATAGGIRTMNVPAPPPEFRTDRFFLFFIK